MDTNQPPFNAVLEQAIVELNDSDTPEGRTKTYKLVLDSQLILPIWNVTDEAGHANGPIKPMWIGLEQANYLPAFTSWEAVKRWKHVTEPPSFVVLSGQGVFVAACEVGSSWVWINLDGPIDMRVPARHMVILAMGAVPGPKLDDDTILTEVQRDKFAFLGPPSESLPKDLMADLSRALEGCPAVRRAFLFQATMGAGNRLTLGLLFDGKPDESMMSDVSRTIGPPVRRLMQGGPFLDMVVLQGKILEPVARGVKPIFERSRTKRWLSWRR